MTYDDPDFEIPELHLDERDHELGGQFYTGQHPQEDDDDLRDGEAEIESVKDLEELLMQRSPSGG